jgi:D-glycero-alpha-D-manno-heptose-7-phosphate kinase
MIIRSKAPLRIGLGGGGTDLSPFCDIHGGYVLNATINLYSYCTIEVTDDDKICYHSLDQNYTLEYAVEKQIVAKKDGDLFTGIYNRIMSDFDLEPRSFRLTTSSDVPSGSGLGGSSTMVVAIIKCFAEWFKLPLGEYEVARLAFDIEREDIGIVGGCQDMYAATFGGFNFIEIYDKKKVIVNPLRIKNWIINEFEASFILYFTGVQRKASLIEEEKKNAVENKTDAVDAMINVKNDALKMKEHILKGEIKNFGSILHHSWKYKKVMSKNVTNPHIDEVYNLAMNNGAYAGKVSGAGGGGFMFFIVDPLKKFELERKLDSFSDDGIVRHVQFTKNGCSSWTI